MRKRPPEILITTPESLNIQLTAKGYQQMLMGIETVILDEIHAVVEGKRGTHLITAVDHLVPLAGEFQRIVLSSQRSRRWIEWPVLLGATNAWGQKPISHTWL